MKTAKEKAFELVADKSKPDPLVMKCVAFDVDDEYYWSNISQNLGGIHNIEASINMKGKKKYITGTIIRLENKKKAITVSHDVQWEENALGNTKIELAVLIPTIELESKLNRLPKSNTTQHRKKRTAGLSYEEEPDGAFLSNEIVDVLFLVDEGEEGNPKSSDDDDLYDGSEDE